MAEPCPILSDHVTEDILARLPAKAVYRCRCLSRAWAATLASDDFADLHLRLANRHGGPRVLLLQDSSSGHDGPPKVQAWWPANPGGTTFTPIVRENRGVVQGTDRAKLVPRLVTQQCRGLVVIEAVPAGTRYVFNPSTGQSAALPEGRLTGCRYRSPDTHYTTLGLGYDTRTRKHKVIRVHYCGCHDKNRPAYAGCEVYVINSTELWRRAMGIARRKPPAGWVIKDGTSVFCQGYVHWLAERPLDHTSNEMFVFSISLHDETFGILPLPSLDLQRNYRLKRFLTALHGRLCLFSTEVVNDVWPCRYDIWLLRRHETGEWDLHYQIDVGKLPPVVANFMRLGDWISPLDIIDNGRRILLIRPRFKSSSSQAPSFKLGAYDPVNNDLEILLDGNGSVANHSMVLRDAAVYEESVASPGQPHRYHLRHVNGTRSIAV